jgi:hypothetical protein
MITEPNSRPGPIELDEHRGPDHWIRVIREGAEEGCRNQTVASLAGYLLRIGVDPRLVCQILLDWNTLHNRPPLPEREVERTLRSIVARELARLKGCGL